MKHIALFTCTVAWLAACDAPSAPTSGPSEAPPISEPGFTHGSASDKGTSVSGLVFNCEVLDPGVTTVTRKGVIHIRGFVGRSLLQVGNPLLDGTLIGSDISITIDPNKGTIKVRGKGTINPTAVPDGSWLFVTLFQEGPNKSGVNFWRGGHGTGSLQGRTFKLEARPLSEPRPNPCNPEDPSAAAVSGFVF
jgi:hypothetical protein